MPYSHRVLIIDDRPEDGEAVARRLWQDQVSNCFVKYDERILGNINHAFHGIRVVFQDIKLLPNTGTPNHSDYGAAAQLLDALLKDNNGPWLMVAWSTWAEDPDKGELYAKELFEYLKDRLPEGKKPYSYVVFDKKSFTVDGNHGEVKGEAELEEEDKQKLYEEIKSVYDKAPSINALSQWERDVSNCASSVVKTLWEMTDGLTASREEELTGLLQKLAKAQDGRVDEDISDPLYEILTVLLNDRLSNIESTPIKLSKAEYSGGSTDINTMLHWSISDATSDKSVPGSVFIYPEQVKDINIITFPTDEKRKGFILEQFVPQDKQGGVKGNDAFFEQSPLVMLDITPPCDHDLRKAFWRRYIIGIKVLSNNASFYYKDDGKLSHDALYITPLFKVGEELYQFIFNSRLIHSFVDKDKMFRRFTCLGRLREQMLHDIVNWYGRMATRPGVVSVE